MNKVIEKEIINEQESIQNVLSKEDKKALKKEAIKIIENSNYEDISIKVELSSEEKIKNFFDLIDFLSLDDNGKEEVALDVKSQSSGDKLYWMEVVLSASIATLGLLIGSSAVIIGAMLITPLLRPINGVSFSIANGGTKFYFTALKVLLISILISICIGYILSSIIGFSSANHEILFRTAPNIIDFFIAVFSAIIGVLSLRFTRLSEGLAGVAMAASLMPPLVIVGIELAILEYSLAFGAFLLFLTNLFAIIVVGTIFFWLYGFSPHIEKKQKFVLHILSLILISIITILFPLYHSYALKKQENVILNNVESFLEQRIQDDDNLEVYDISLKKNNDRFQVNATIIAPEGYNIADMIDNVDVEEFLGGGVELNLNVLRAYKIIAN